MTLIRRCLSSLTLAMTIGCASIIGVNAYASTSAAMGLTKAEGLVTKLTHGKAKIVNHFSATTDLYGFVLEPKAGGEKMILYVAKSGDYAVAGNLISAEGKNLTEEFAQKYIISKQAADAFANIDSLHWFTEGSDAAPHKAYVFIDPNCAFCHLLYKEIQPLIKKGELQVRFVAVGFLKPSSAGKAAAILNAGSNEASVALFLKDEQAFNMRDESGGIQPIKPDPSNMAVTTAFSRVSQNTAFFKTMGFIGTPTILYVTQSGEQKLYPGYPQAAQLKTLLAEMGANWK